jgi:hypothetical protein
MRNLTIVLGTCLVAAGCGAPADDSAEAPISLEAGKDDLLGNRHIDQFAGVLHFDDQGHDEALPRAGYKLGYTFRAHAGKSFKLWSRLDGGDRPSTTLKLYGPRASDGRYPYVAAGKVVQDGGRASVTYTTVINEKPAKDGIYLVVESAAKAGTATVGLACGNADSCELSCIVPLFYQPVCGEDGQTYGNKPSAACFDAPIAHAGACCVDNQACLQGWHWDSGRCQCVSPCETVKCAVGTHCVAAGAVRCVPDLTPCKKTGCSGEVCAADDVITTCDWQPQYACYADATCERQPDGSCGFTETNALTSCLAGYL